MSDQEQNQDQENVELPPVEDQEHEELPPAEDDQFGDENPPAEEEQEEDPDTRNIVQKFLDGDLDDVRQEIKAIAIRRVNELTSEN